MTSCPLTAVHDDVDDFMLPNRLESGIAALTSSNDASYGFWINFSDSSGEMRGFLGKIGFGAGYRCGSTARVPATRPGPCRPG